MKNKILKPNDIKSISLALWDKEKSGYVYVITNPAWKGWVKIGKAMDAEDRCNSYQTSSPLRDYVLKYRKKFDNRATAEFIAHKNAGRLAKQRKGEWFSIKLKDAIEAINTVELKKPVNIIKCFFKKGLNNEINT